MISIHSFFRRLKKKLCGEEDRRTLRDDMEEYFKGQDEEERAAAQKGIASQTSNDHVLDVAKYMSEVMTPPESSVYITRSTGFPDERTDKITLTTRDWKMRLDGDKTHICLMTADGNVHVVSLALIDDIANGKRDISEDMIPIARTLFARWRDESSKDE